MPAHAFHALLSSRHEQRLAWSLAGVAGVLNATGFCVAGIFSGNMTGNVTSLADQIATGHPRAGFAMLAIVLMFIVGGSLSALFLEIRGSAHVAQACATAFLTEAVLLVVLAGFDIRIRTESQPLLILGLSFLLGFQNAAAAVVSNYRVRTTHVSGTSTDISVKLGLLVAQVLHEQTLEAIRDHLPELKTKVLTIAAFCTGAVIGVTCYGIFGRMTLLMAALWIIGLCIPPLIASSRRHA